MTFAKENKMDNDTAKSLVLRLRRYSYGTSECDRDLVTRALRLHPDAGHIACGFLILYYSAKKAMPEYELHLLVSVILVASALCWLASRSIKRLQFVQDMFLVSACCELADVLNQKCEQVGDGDAEEAV